MFVKFQNNRIKTVVCRARSGLRTDIQTDIHTDNVNNIYEPAIWPDDTLYVLQCGHFWSNVLRDTFAQRAIILHHIPSTFEA